VSNIARSDLQVEDAKYQEFVRLLSVSEKSVRRFIRSLLPTSDGLDDMIQNTALECWKKFDDFDGGEDDVDAFVRWACVIARYKVLSHCRDHSRDRLVFRESVISSIADRSYELLGEKDRQRNSIEECLQQMDSAARRLLLSVYSPGDSVAKIASETGRKQRLLYTRLNSLRAMLLQCVTEKMAQANE